MKKTWKSLLILLCIGIISLQFSGCGNKAVTDSDSDVKTINIWTKDSHSKGIMNELMIKFNQTVGQEQGINLVYTVKEGNYYQIMDLAIAANQEPDIYQSIGIQKPSESGYIIALEDMPGGQEFVKKYENYFIKNFHTYNGKTYAVPFSVTTIGIAYNKEMFKAKGIADENGEAKPPQTFDEVREYAKKLTDPSKQEYGIVMPLKWGDFYNSNVAKLAMGAVGFTDFNPVSGEYDFSGIKQVVNMYMGIKQDKSFFPGLDGLDNDPARAQFSEGKIGMKISYSYDVGVFNDQFPAKMEWGVAPLPVSDVNNKYKQFLDVGSVFVINKKTVDSIGADKVMTVYKWLNSDDMFKELYKEGKYIPYNADIVKDVVLDKPIKEWENFCKLGKISTNAPSSVPYDISGEKDPGKVFLEDILTGNVSVDNAMAELTVRLNKGVKKKLEQDSSIDINEYINKNWDARLK